LQVRGWGTQFGRLDRGLALTILSGLGGSVERNKPFTRRPELGRFFLFKGAA
jgi:hypothetical protein